MKDFECVKRLKRQLFLTEQSISLHRRQVCRDGCPFQRVWIRGSDRLRQHDHGGTPGCQSWQSSEEVQRPGEQQCLPVSALLAELKLTPAFLKP